MNLSFYALHRLCEKGKETIKNKKINILASIPDGRALSDEKLLEKLERFGIKIKYEDFLQMVTRFFSAEEMYYWYRSQEYTGIPDQEEDWLWICLLVLWERWAPTQPSLEMIDERMQMGYDKMEAGEVIESNEIWLKTWTWILKVMDEKNIKTIDDFDEKFRGTQSVYNWVQDLEIQLYDAGHIDTKFFKARLKFSGEFLKRFSQEDINVTRNMKRAFAETHFLLGDKKTAESLFEEWLEQNPTWGWGWIYYSDCYWITDEKTRDFEIAEKILKRGLEVPQLEDREYLIDRLVELYDESGHPEKADDWQPQHTPPAITSQVKYLIPSKKRRKKKKKRSK